MVFLIKVPTVMEDTTREKIFSLSDSFRIEKAVRIKDDQKQICSLVGGLLLKYSTIGYDNFYKNLSHSGNLCVVAIHQNAVGVDVQYIKRVSDRVIDRVCSDAEIAFLEQCEDKTSEFIKLWSKKEAYFKSLGELNSMPIITKTCFVKCPPVGYIFESQRVCDEYFLTVCYKE